MDHPPMSIIGHGIDIVETARIQRLVEEHGDRFLKRCFTEAELAYAVDNPARRVEHLSGRFAAKESVLKALGTGLSGGITWNNIDVVRLPSGQPEVRLTGKAAEIAAGLGITKWLVTISHVRSHATASVLAMG
ncbi:MAG: holo-ACP synthase [Phycisphaeraceae bacterium]|nr:holo-ACP synthase [Phycisphaeraceae bacterium]